MIGNKSSENRFIDHGDGTISDQSTGLMWMKNISPEMMTLSEAFNLPKTFSNHSDWLIPSVDEIKSILPIDDRTFNSPTDCFYHTRTHQSTPGNSYTIYKIINNLGESDWFVFGTSKKAFVRLMRYTSPILIVIDKHGTGEGVVSEMLLRGSQSPHPTLRGYTKGSTIKLQATPSQGSIFKRWSGDLNSFKNKCLVYADCQKSIFAEFDLLTYPLTLQTKGSGEGSITPSSTAAQHPHGSTVTLQATAAEGSKFKQWGGDASGTHGETMLKIDSAKTVTAEFVRMHSLKVSIEGNGLVKQSVLAEEHETGSTVTLTATPAEGHEFVQWHGAATGSKPAYTLAMNTSKVVKAEFHPLPMFSLKVTHTGTGCGTVLPNKQEFWKGSRVELEAKAAAGCVFDGWGGDLDKGLKSIREVTVNSNMVITAAFSRVEVQETDVALTFDYVSFFDAKDSETMVFYFTVSNRSDKQVQLELPLAGFVTAQGEEIEQFGWAEGMLDGEKSVTLRASTFRKMGLIFDKRRLVNVALGEHLHITLMQNRPAQRLTFAYRCTDEDKGTMTLVNASVEPLENEGHSDKATATAHAELTSRMHLLEKSLQEALSRLSAAPAVPPPVAAPTQTLPEILAWLCTQSSAPLAVLRQKLLPLGLMPSAVMNDVNECAFDVAGEPALEEAADTVTVQRGVLLQVLAVW